MRCAAQFQYLLSPKRGAYQIKPPLGVMKSEGDLISSTQGFLSMMPCLPHETIFWYGLISRSILFNRQSPKTIMSIFSIFGAKMTPEERNEIQAQIDAALSPGSDDSPYIKEHKESEKVHGSGILAKKNIKSKSEAIKILSIAKASVEEATSKQNKLIKLTCDLIESTERLIDFENMRIKNMDDRILNRKDMDNKLQTENEFFGDVLASVMEDMGMPESSEEIDNAEEIKDQAYQKIEDLRSDIESRKSELRRYGVSI